MKKIIVMIGVALLLVASCGPSGPPAKLATKAEEIAGTWHRTELIEGWDMYLQITADGKAAFTRSPEVSGFASAGGEFSFEGTQWHFTLTTFTQELGRRCHQMGEDSAIYQIQLLENGNLKFVEVDEACPGRRSTLATQWEPVR